MDNEFQFTRYLYEKEEVKLSLILCILNKKEEAIFWAYELYYSGFKAELVNLFWTMYYDFYYTSNPSFEKYLLKKLNNNLNFETNCEHYLSMIVNNFMIRPHSMDIFMLKQIVNMCEFETNDVLLESVLQNEDYMILASLILSQIKDDCLVDTLANVIQYFIKKGLNLDSKKIVAEYKKIIKNDYHSNNNNNKRVILLARLIHYFASTKNIKMGKNIYVHIEPEDVIIYENIYADLRSHDLTPILPAYKILPLATIYYIDQYNYLSLFHLKREKNNITTVYRDKWLYYASFSPLWRERIVRYKGIIDEKTQTIMFQEGENSDDNEQAFYNEFGYEPDEQKIETQNKTIQEIKSERTWASFYSEHKTNGILELDDYILNDIGKVIYNF
jgi:hypothetical protein